MAAITGNFSITRGDSHIESWVLTDASGSAVDITGGKLYLTIKNAQNDADPGVLQLTSPSSGITIDDAAAGEVTLTITATQSDALTPLDYFYDIQYKDSAGLVSTLANARLTVLADITRSAA